MKIVFIRHGECDKSGADERGFIGLGRDLAPLTAVGVAQAQAAAESPLLSGCQLILSSPYTRALQTAAIIAGRTGLGIQVEMDLHELIPDKTFQVRGEAEAVALHEDFKRCHGACPPGESRRWETLEELVRRTKPVLDHYLAEGYEKIAVVAHGGLIRRYTGELVIGFCHVSEMVYSADFRCYGWIA